MHLMRNSENDWHIEIRGRTPPLRWGPVIGWDVTVYQPDGTVQATRFFRNPVSANDWADSWGLPRELTEHV